MHCVEPRPHPNGERTVISYPDQNVTMIIAYSITSRDVIRTFGSGYETKQAGGGGGGASPNYFGNHLDFVGWGQARDV